ncbi:alpha/beta fold hydrolase [Pseudarthrobacter sp. H2]|uniref:alpha/beta fold hydrolase n=1 Tax=Pseudarthrobacter sp. H2 TaxID=3418415 RepID=UPI003CF6A9FA
MNGIDPREEKQMRNWTHHQARINGLDMHYVEEGDGPLVVLLHGFPHTWFSWRHQISALAAAGYRVVAPDLRGMGQTDAPWSVADYRCDNIVRDICALLDHLGERQAVFSGMDFGMFVAYDIACERPERVRGLLGLQYATYSAYDRLPSEVERERGRAHFNHMSYYVENPEAARADYDAHPREIITKIFNILSADGDFSRLYAHPPGTAYRHALPKPPPLPWKWLNEWEVEAYVSDYSRSGFHGGINWYLAADINWEYRQRRGPSVSSVPLYFVASEVDVAVAEKYGEGLPAQLAQNHNDVRALRAVSGGGYLLAMERPREVNEAFIDFLRDLDRRGAGRAEPADGFSSVDAR